MQSDKRACEDRLRDFSEVSARVPLPRFLELYDQYPEFISACLNLRVSQPGDREVLLDFLTDMAQPEEVRVARFELLAPYLESEQMMEVVIGSIHPSDEMLQEKIRTMCHNLGIECDYTHLMQYESKNHIFVG